MNAIEIISKLKKHKVLPVWDGEQLKLTGEIKSLPAEVLQDVKTCKVDIIAFLAENAQKINNAPIPRVPEAMHYPLTNAQKRIWVLSQFEGGNMAYNITDSLYLNGTLHFSLFEQAFLTVIQRHESLRTVFQEVDGEPVQIIRQEVDFKISYEDITGSEPDTRRYLKEQVREAHSWSFNLENGPLTKVRMIRFSATEHAMIFAMHHIISDGWSIGVLLMEVMGIYKALCLKSDYQSSPLPIQYKDYAAWLNARLADEKGSMAAKFWQDQHFDEVEPLLLPLDYTRPQINRFEGAQLKYYWDKALYDRIITFAKQQNTTLFNFFRATVSILLHKYSNQDDIVIGTPVAARNHFDLENQIGLYVNTIPLRSSLTADVKFADYLKGISLNSLRSFEYQDFPLDNIIAIAGVKRDTARNPLFDVMIVLQNTAIGDGSIEVYQQHGFTMDRLDKYIYAASRTEQTDVSAKFDLMFNFATEPVQQHFLEIEYRTKLFKKSSIQQVYQSYLHVLQQVLDNADIPVSAIELTDVNERNKILYEFNKPITDFSERSMQELFTGVFDRQPDALALVTGEAQFTYAAVKAKALGTAAYLTRLLKGEQQPKVGMLLQRNENILFSILGILYAKAAYVPVDIKYPENRVAYIIGDASPQVLLVDEKGKALVPEDYQGQVVLVSEIPSSDEEPQASPDLYDQVAYLIYTSGSTGIPKGVEITHKNAVAFLKWADQEFADTPYRVLYSPTSYCFDLSVFEYFIPLIQGKTLRILESAASISDYLSVDRNILINTVPSVVRNLIDEGVDWTNVVALNMAGEPVPKIFKKQLDHRRIEIRNLYGPSEDTTYSTFYRFRDDGTDNIPIGVPVGFTQMYILDKGKNILPVGVEGEIYLSGHSVARGYLNKPELTAERFTDNPFLPGYRMYRTGDVGKWLPDGQAEYAGRIDDQVKVRGYRIELGEIQFMIEQIEGIDQAVVVVKEINGDQYLVAYWQTTSGIDEHMVKQVLRQKLPEFMVPSYCVALERIPLNSNGKVDKSQLPSPVFVQKTEKILPKTPNQETLLRLWEETLQVHDFGIADNFFDLGGHSLKATRLKALIARHMGKALTLNDIFQHPTIELQAALLDTRGRMVEQQIEKSVARSHYPLSLSQERLWVLTRFEDASKAYHMPAAFHVSGALDVAVLEKALMLVIARHEILRTVFREVDGIPVQVVLEPEELNFSAEVVTTQKTGDELIGLLAEKWVLPFDLSRGPLLKTFVIRHPHGQILSFNMHHIISDGWSIGVLFKDVVRAYAMVRNNNGKALPVLELQFKDFALWQRSTLTDSLLAEQLAYWKDEVFTDGVPQLEMPADYHRPEIKTYNGDVYRKTFSRTVLNGLVKLAHESGASLFMTILASVNILLKKYANQDDIVIGTPVAGRDNLQLQHQIGFYVNTLALRTKLSGKQSFNQLLQQQRQQFLRSFEYQHFPFEMLVESLNLKRDLSRSPIFDVMVVLQNMEGLGTDDLKHLDADITLEQVEATSGITKYDLTFSFAQSDDALQMELEYNTDLYAGETISRLAEHLGKVFQAVLAHPDTAIEDIPLLSPAELAVIGSKADQTSVGYNREETILSLFREAVEAYPANIAVRTTNGELTYSELDMKSGQLAFQLKKAYTIEKDDLIILHNNRSEWMIISILAVLKLGAAYVPVDPEYPEDRIDYMLKDSGASVVIYDTPLSATVMQGNPAAYVDITTLQLSGETYEAWVTPENLAYVIYTSGTTGKPKGVLIEHRNLTRLLFNENDLFDFNERDKWSLFHSYCFDFSVWEMYGALLKGGTVVMVPKSVAQDSTAFFDFLLKEKVTVLNQTPTAFRSLLQLNQHRLSEKPDALRYLIFGGEALAPGLLAPWHQALPTCKIINMYGITETTVHVTYKEITGKEIEANKSNIGIPIPTLSCYVLDRDLRQVPYGVIGELCVGGAGVARGYHNKPELTAEKFVDNPFTAGGKMYRSGDFARILPDGDLEYIGRKDDQVKIRGHRIETGEIEAAINSLPQVKDAVVITHKNKNDEYELVAYYIAEGDGQFNPGEVLRAKLPSYMVPGYLVALEKFPLTSNGKLDKNALPLPQDVAGGFAEYVPPRNEIDERIIVIWQDILEREKIGIRDNFFDMGGHSLKATRVISKIQEAYGVKVDLKNLFIDPTVEHLSDYVETLVWMESQSKNAGVEEELIL